MDEIDYPELQSRYPGRCVAQRDGEVIAAEPTYEALIETLEANKVDWKDLLILYVESPDVVATY